MTSTTHPLAPDHLPFFITPPGETDTMMINVAIFLVGGILLAGVLYLTLHSLPERIAHKRNAMQLQLIAVLAVLALFTHNNLFWLLALLLAIVELPDIMGPLRSIARSLEIATARAGETPQAPDTTDRPDHV